MLRSVDWLTVSQEFARGDLPQIGAGWVLSVDFDGAHEWEVQRGYLHEGSHDTRCRIRCNGRRLEFSGNPSRYGRLDNVWGFQTVAESLDRIVNPMLAELDLPPFTFRTRGPQRYERNEQVMPSDGAVLTRVDLAAMYACGSVSDRDAFLRALGQVMHHGKRAKCWDGTTRWGSARTVQHSAYNKSGEMKAHKPKTQDEGTIEYRQQLAAWMDQQGAVRLESKLFRDFLRKHGLRQLATYDDERANAMVDEMIKKALPEVGTGGMHDIAHELMGMGHSETVAYHAQGLAFQWAAGVDVFETMKRPTAYQYRRILKQVGLDIRQPCVDVTALHVRPRVVTLQPLQPPSWYRHAA